MTAFDPFGETGGLGAALRVEADLSTQARVKAACELTAQPKLGNGRGALERWQPAAAARARSWRQARREWVITVLYIQSISVM